MSDMIGNPHFADHLCNEVESGDARAISTAIFAHSFEQRTATLVAYWSALTGLPEGERLTPEMNRVAQELQGEIHFRLDLGTTE